jgi:DNA-binding SARP family transcriptional activator
LLQRAESIDPFIEKVYLFLGEALYKNGNKKEACAHYAKALERKEMPMEDYDIKCK